MRKQGISDEDIAIKINRDIEYIKNIKTKNVELKDDGKIVNTNRKRNTKKNNRLINIEAKIDEIHKMLTTLVNKNIHN